MGERKKLLAKEEYKDFVVFELYELLHYIFQLYEGFFV
jgi:hypothetical protein